MDELEYRRLLKALPRSIEPERDLFPGIALRLDARAPRARARPPFPFAAAAGFVAVVFAAGWLLLQRMPQAAQTEVAQQSPALLREAQALRVEYDAAWPVGAADQRARLREQADPRLVAAWTELDAAESELREALTLDPDARFLLHRLKQVQDQRLQLTRKALSA